MIVERPDGTVLYATAEGSGPDVVLSHALFSDLRVFDPLTTLMVRAGFRVVRWDARGHGRSTRGPGRTRFVDLVDDLRAVLDATDTERPVLIGHDIGGILALALALDAPERVAALSLWSTDAAPTPVVQRVAAALVAAARSVTIRPVTLALEPLWIRRAEGHDPTLAALHRRCASTLSAAALAEVVEALSERPDLRPRLRSLTQPVQVLWGDRDVVVRPTAGRELVLALPAAEGGPIADAGHLVHVDRPEAVGSQVLDWLSRIRTA